jgi:carboxypeptidase family protein
MKRLGPIALVAAMLPAAGLAAAPASGNIDGRIVLSPAVPVEHVGTPSERPIAGRVAIIGPAGAVVAEVNSDADGAFHVSLPPGRYVLRLESPGRPGRAADQAVTVASGRATNAVITYDAGIR